MNLEAPVSVIIPCWRCAGSIGQAVASVAAQTRRPYEVILIDDASGDGTLETLYQLASQYPADWIKVIARESNGGPGLARNTGWAAAASLYIAFLDSDDAWFPEKIARQTAWMEAHPEAILSAHQTILWRLGDPIPAVPDMLPACRINLLKMLWFNRFPTRTVMIRRDIALRFGQLSHSEDYLLWLEIVASGAPCYLIQAVMACCFRPEFSPGGYSGQLWRHERCELVAFASLWAKGGLGFATWIIVSAWSLIKFLRRAAIMLPARRRKTKNGP